jgi:DNA-binding transcriptional LysR family regulator
VDLDQIRAFLILTEELHFGRTAERLFRSQPRISRLIASLETEIGGTLFDRTNRRVSLTSLGADLETRLRPAYSELLAARDAARRTARDTAGQIRVAFTSTIEGPTLTRLVDAFSVEHPDCEIVPVEVDMAEPYGPLRRDEADVLVNWLVGEEPGFTLGPAIDCYGRVLAVSRNDPLAEQESISSEQIAGRAFARIRPDFNAVILDAFYPRSTPSGTPLPRTNLARTWVEVINLVARGLVVHPTVTLVAAKLSRDDIALVPITDLPPLPLGILWLTTRENARIRALAQTVRHIAGPPVIAAPSSPVRAEVCPERKEDLM